MDIQIPALTEVPASVLAVLAERLRQHTRYGHTPDADDAAPPAHLMRRAHVLALDAADIRCRSSNPADLERARRKAIQTAALCLAEIERIDRELKPAADQSFNQGVPRQ
ncbi:hypothetical protein [Novosphingobium sp. KN65.2]|uniref:hypothetical protein n=1 Tax=Novosphingobium sp. KN65.2 TaxID=1478134 RepID=UPI0005E022CF|nr:hypothetical protein [Novosphingobium sp. KN65.2]CDO35797.1 hypothetical protein SPHV1_2270143 [Novosphingobium sp. KN65.2]